MVVSRKTQIFNDKNVTHDMMILKYDCHMDNVFSCVCLLHSFVFCIALLLNIISTHNIPMYVLCTATLHVRWKKV